MRADVVIPWERATTRTTDASVMLTPRQDQSVRAAIRYGSYKMAAYHLGINESTLKNHVSNAMHRIGASSLAQLAYVLWLRDLWQ